MSLGDDDYSKRALLAQYIKRFGDLPTLRQRSWCPQSPHEKQRIFLSLSCREALYGGAAGGGKTSSLLMAALQYVHVPDYSALILRRTYKDLAMTDAVMDRSKTWLAGTQARWSELEKRWRFPSGATIKFGHLDHDNDLDQYQGAAFHFIGFDEVTQFTERQYKYLLSRNRRGANSQIPLRIRATGNPGGRGHQWVFDRFVRHKPIDDPNIQFVPATLEDNPYLDREAYRKNLEQLDATTRAQLLEGLWVQDSTGLIYPYNDDINGINEEPKKELEKILAIDFGAALNKPTTAFAVSAYSKTDPKHVWGLESYSLAGLIPTTIAEEIKSIKHRHDIVKVVADAGALGVGYIEEIKRRHHIWVEAAKKSDKRGFRKLMRGDLERGVFKIVRETNKQLIEEMRVLCWDEHGLDTAKGSEDHLTDAMLYAWREARYYHSKEKEEIPMPGTTQRADWEEKQIFNYIEELGKSKKKNNGGFYYDDNL